MWAIGLVIIGSKKCWSISRALIRRFSSSPFASNAALSGALALVYGEAGTWGPSDAKAQLKTHA